jgi:hypothetical protein
MGHDDLSYQFYEGLYKKENITKEEFIEYNFICCGIFVPKKTTPKLNEQLIPLYEYNFEKSHHPKKYMSNELYKKIKHRYIYKRNCICGQTFKRNCFIYSESNDILLNIGICCNEQFNENGIKKFCNLCKVQHKNYKNNFCNECRSKIHLNCSNCGNDKSNNIKYLYSKLCYTCKFGNVIYEHCSQCGETKTSDKDRKFKNCFNCNNRKFKNCFNCNNY